MNAKAISTDRIWINLGSGKHPLDGYVNIDAHEEADVMGDVWDLHFRDVDAVRMDHFLEHFGWREIVPLLESIHSWMAPGGLLEVEVPDMAEILKLGTTGDWLRYLYGSQQHDGEFHRCGFTAETLCDALVDAGFQVTHLNAFLSEFPTRTGMPCLKATARA